MKLLSVIGLVFFLGNALSHDCTTPLNQKGQCIQIYDCPPLYSQLKKRPLSRETWIYLRSSVCGYSGDKPFVCCAIGPPIMASISSSVIKHERIGSAEINEDGLPAPRDQCGKVFGDGRIYGGEKTELDEFPWMVLLGYKKEYSSDTNYKVCGGVLINRRYVLTAAHCVTGPVTQLGKLDSVRVGEYDTRTNPDCIKDDCADLVQEIKVAEIFPHAGFNADDKSRTDDIALVKLAGRANYSDFVKPICLPRMNTVLPTGTTTYVAGWGKTLLGRDSPVKLKLDVNIYDKSQCTRKYRTLGAYLIENQLCAGGEYRKDSCNGDSGGPLMYLNNNVWECIGVVSFGYGCGEYDWPGIYTSVSHYLPWILDILKGTSS